MLEILTELCDQLVVQLPPGPGGERPQQVVVHVPRPDALHPGRQARGRREVR